MLKSFLYMSFILCTDACFKKLTGYLQALIKKMISRQCRANHGFDRDIHIRQP